MGLCFSSEVNHENAGTTQVSENETGVPQSRGNGRDATFKPCPPWTSEEPMTSEDLQRRRDEFWGTQPAYGGEDSTWNLLKEVCNTPFKKQKSLLDGAKLSVPTGRLIDGCYDDKGFLYIIPAYCLSEPQNLVKSKAGRSRNQTDQSMASSTNLSSEETETGEDLDGENVSSGKKAKKNGSETKLNKGNEIVLTFRFSSGKDTKITTTDENTLYELVGQMNLAPTETPRFFTMGKELDKKAPIKKLKLHQNSVVQAMIVSSIKVNS